MAQTFVVCTLPGLEKLMSDNEIGGGGGLWGLLISSPFEGGLNRDGGLFERAASGCKESQFYSLPFGQAVASMY